MSQVELNLEQEFNLRSFEAQVKKLNYQESQDFLVKLYHQMLIREVMYHRLIKSNWGIYSPNLDDQELPSPLQTDVPDPGE